MTASDAAHLASCGGPGFALPGAAISAVIRRDLLRSKPILKRRSNSARFRAECRRGIGEEATAAVQDQEFVLYHSDDVEASGFTQHLKLPHYADLQAKLPRPAGQGGGMRNRLKVFAAGASSVIWDAAQCAAPHHEGFFFNAMLRQSCFPTLKLLRRSAPE